MKYIIYDTEFYRMRRQSAVDENMYTLFVFKDRKQLNLAKKVMVACDGEPGSNTIERLKKSTTFKEW